jgi:CubicO group peptidase (beta-lactamase class C family)
MQACSMNKPVSVVAALRMAEQGLLDLDADVSSYLTRWRMPSNDDWRPGSRSSSWRATPVV